MRQSNDAFLRELEIQIKSDLEEKVGITKISQLKDFPYKDFEEILKAINENKISLASEYNYDRLEIYATKTEFKWQSFWLFLPILLAIVDIVLAFTLKEYTLLFGCLGCLLGHFTSSPYFKLRDAMASITLIVSIVCIFLNWKLAIIVGSYTLSLIFTMTARESYQQVVIRRALSSESLFIWLFLAKALLIRDNNTRKMILPLN
jgi:hypothetical protein